MKTALISHPDCLAHKGTPGYQEVPQRLSVVLTALADLDLRKLDAPLATRENLLRVHSDEHIDRMLQKVPPGQTITLDYDTALDCSTADAALRAAGAVCRAVDGVMDKAYTKAFCAVRPPGHHAEPAQAMGFCYFSAIAIAALRAKQVHGLARVAVVDFDVHHGNGTQAALTNIPGMYFASIHQHPHYPGTGEIVDTPNIRNIPMPAGTSAKDWCTAFANKIISDLHDFKPEIILVSAGFDAHKDDPLGVFNLTEADYAWLGASLSETADKYSNGRLVSVLEGGYNLRALANSARAYVEAL